MVINLMITFAIHLFDHFIMIACSKRKNARKSRGSLGGLGLLNITIVIGLLLKCICRLITVCGTFRLSLIYLLSIPRSLCFRKLILVIVDIK